MNGAQLNSLIQKGYKQSAVHTGTPYDVYRSAAPGDPLNASNKLTTVNAAFGVNPQFTAPPTASTIYWYIVTDDGIVNVGDYLIQGANRWVVVSELALLPMQALFVPNTISIERPTGPSGFGATSYSNTDATSPVAANVPAYITVKKEVGSPPAKLPGDASRRTYWRIVCYLPENTIQDRDVLVDELGNRYQVTANNRGLLGYDILCERLEA